MGPIDRSYTTYYWSVITAIQKDDLAPFSSYSTLNNIVTLKSRLGVTQGHWTWHHSIDRIRVPISVPYCYIVSFARYNESIAKFLYPTCI